MFCPYFLQSDIPNPTDLKKKRIRNCRLITDLIERNKEEKGWTTGVQYRNTVVYGVQGMEYREERGGEVGDKDFLYIARNKSSNL